MTYIIYLKQNNEDSFFFLIQQKVLNNQLYKYLLISSLITISLF